MKYKTFIQQALILFICALTSVSCSDLNIFHDSDKKDTLKSVYTMYLDCPTPSYDSIVTRTTNSWEDGSIIYLQFGATTGVATYNAYEKVWSIITSASLTPTNTEQTCTAYYFENPISVTDSIVELSEKSICYKASGSYTYLPETGLYVKALLKPNTWRMRFQGMIDKNISISGKETDITYYTSFDHSDGSFKSETKDLNLIVDDSGYTPYIYGSFVNKESNTLTVTTENKYVRTINTTNLKPGESGVIIIPNVGNFKSEGWTCKENYMEKYTGSFSENFFFGDTVNVIIMQDSENPNVFHVMAPFECFSGGGDEYLKIELLRPGISVINGITVTREDLVYFYDYNTGYHHPTYNGEIMMYHPSRFSTDSEKYWLNNKVLAYQEDGKTPGQIQLAPRYYMNDARYWDKSQSDGVIIITFPGYVPKDFSAKIEYLGVMTGTSGSPQAAINLTLGKDVVDARAAVVKYDVNTNTNSVAEAIAAGNIKGYPVISGNNFVPIEKGLSGKLMIVVVVLDKGVVKTCSSVNFDYDSAGNSWKSIGMGLYTEDFISGLYSVDPVTYEVQIEESSDSPGLYRMLSPYGAAFPYNEDGDYDTSTPYNIVVNAVDPEGVFIEAQPTGVDWGHGPMSIQSWGARYFSKNDFETVKAAGYLGKLDNGVITLPVFERTASDGSTAYYQGLVYLGDKAYYGCPRAAFKLVLPSATTTSARARAAQQTKARIFARHLNAFSKVSMKDSKVLKNRVAYPMRNNMITR